MPGEGKRTVKRIGYQGDFLSCTGGIRRAVPRVWSAWSRQVTITHRGFPDGGCDLRFDSTQPKTQLSLSYPGPPPIPGAAPEPGKDRVTNSEEHRRTGSVEDNRLRLIRQRLRSDFYEVPPASEHIAVSVMAELQDLDERASALPR